MNFHILLLYYRRSKFINNALSSILFESSYYGVDRIWTTVVDDTPSDFKEEYAINNDSLEYFCERMNLEFIQVGDSLEQKQNQGGSRMGWGMQEAVQQWDPADLVMMLCDDDCIYKGFFGAAKDYFLENDSPWAYGYAMEYDADNDPVWPELDELGLFYPIDTNAPYCKSVPAPNHLDISQVVWRRQAQLDFEIEFPYPIHPKKEPLDYWFYKAMEEYHGNCPPIGTIAQYKGLHSGQVSKS